ncbi:ABC transporter ATP-binding protein [Sulfitobacter donghicola]|uniref:Sugar ABC transporter ATP-binding protein n=1 Tax=Sulfitobacter donghicola DSW-25 = KCTC 12864 = JCM 14565 TaxID=1300350 RepID=A0A073IE43_9RHOB|nr:ABC transporter ATP-binding protein [Sulfitobacter donghicola]KEJ87840.1 sugar ABC transporter ATP-binding protein [Sulfitobacter donghicola DSW-25 = KCTC 12864 = JCM 14565]KIN60021.1 ABC transporter, ATP-binding protein [Sulfitobacter donghicola DSW-25 = KCTC 12864 = JCM 14565]
MTQTQGEALRLEGITKRFGKLTANDAVSLSLNAGEVVALLGENGAGKTTLMNILFGQYTPDAGTVRVFGKTLASGNSRAAIEAGVGMVHQHFTLADNLTVLENITLGVEPMTRFRADHKGARERILTLSQNYHLEVSLDAKVGALTVGERQRVEILKALYRDVRILILDEPTAVLTPQEVDKLFATLRLAIAGGLSIVFISHKLHEVLDIADRVVVLRHGKVVGEADTKDTDKAALATMMMGTSAQAPDVAAATPGKALLKLAEVSTPDRGNAPGLKSASLDLLAGQIIGLAGVSGNGQAALADIVGGVEKPASGQLVLNDTVITDWTPRSAVANGIARIPEDRHKTGTIADFDLTQNAVLERYTAGEFSKAGWMNWRAARKFATDIIAKYDVRCPGPETPIRLLSGGNMQKLILGRTLEAGPQVILANQPVRGLDIGAVNYVHSQLLAARDRGAAVLLISEDLDEIMALSDVIHVIADGRLSPGFDRGTMTPAQLGLWMAGQGTEGEPDYAT